MDVKVFLIREFTQKGSIGFVAHRTEGEIGEIIDSDWWRASASPVIFFNIILITRNLHRQSPSQFVGAW